MIHLTQSEYDALIADRLEAQRLRALINTPVIDDFLKGVKQEAAHQVERWGAAHDEGKTPYDFLWLVAHLATRAAEHHKEAERLAAENAEFGFTVNHDPDVAHHREKALHHTITAAAALAHWHAQMAGAPTTFRPGAPNPDPGARLAADLPAADDKFNNGMNFRTVEGPVISDAAWPFPDRSKV